MLLHEARNDRDAPGLARLTLWLGIGATIGANLAYGAGYGLLEARRSPGTSMKTLYNHLTVT